MRRREGLRSGWGSGLAAMVALAVAIVVCGASRPAQAATSTAYVTLSFNALTTAIGADNTDSMPTSDIGVGSTPLYLAANPSGTRVYVPNRFGIQPAAPSRTGVGVRSSGSGIGNS